MNVSSDMAVFERLARDCEVCVYRFPVPVELFVADVGELTEVERKTNIGLVIRFRIVR